MRYARTFQGLLVGSKQGLMVAVLLLGLGSSATASAQVLQTLLPENKIWTGAQCVPGADGKEAAVVWKYFAVRATNIQNVSDKPRYVVCSLTTDSEDTWSDYSIPLVADGHANIHIQLNYATAAGATTTCTAQVVVDGIIAETVTGSVQGPGGTARVDLTLPGLTLGNGEDNPVGVNCLLPPMVRLNAIRLEETAITDINLAPIL